MKKFVLFISVILMAIAVNAQATVEVSTTTNLKLKLLRRDVTHNVFGNLTNKDYKTMKVKTECGDLVKAGVSNFLRDDLKRWILVEKLNARKGTYKKYVLKFGEVDSTNQMFYLVDSSAKIPGGIVRSYKQGFGKFTQDLVRKRVNNTYASLITDEALKKYMRKTIRKMTKLTTKDISKKMTRRKKWVL